MIEEELSKIGLEVYQQNFSALPPIALVQQVQRTIQGRRIVRASFVLIRAHQQSREGTYMAYLEHRVLLQQKRSYCQHLSVHEMAQVMCMV